MSTTFASRMQATSLRLLKTYGSPVNCISPVINSYDPTTSTTVEGTDTNYSGYGNASPFNLNEKLIPGSTIQQGDLKFIFYSTTRPQVNDIFLLNDNVGYGNYRVMAVDIENVNSTDIVYIIQLRQ